MRVSGGTYCHECGEPQHDGEAEAYDDKSTYHFLALKGNTADEEDTL